MRLKNKILPLLLGITVLGVNFDTEAAMNYDTALKYQQEHSKEIFVVNQKTKDINGEKNIDRYFNLMGKNGNQNNGRGMGDRTYINLVMNYGFENIPSKPYVYIRWIADLAGKPDQGYEPKNINISLSDGTVLTYNLQGWEYHFTFLPGLFGGYAHTYDGRIKFSEEDLYSISQHGNIVAISIDTGDGHIKNFFYSGDKQIKEKEKFNAGIHHAIAMMEITPEKIEARIKEIAEQKEIERKARLRAEVEAEIREEQEKAELRKQILAEIATKQ